ncbi:MAG: tyrosine-protein phosphatase [Chloroflexi bacterium]|nr:tyrosine-protein phosphatase [Chloroflexota bacterium]
MGSSSPSRHLPLDRSYNIRDLGGYLISDGLRTRWRTLLRGDALHRLTPAAQAALLAEGVRTIVDLRWTFELAMAPNVFATAATVRYHHLSLLDEVMQPADLPEPGFPTYRLLLDARQAAIRATLATLAAPGALPAIFHCTAGKDRTGVISALLLALSGVPDDTIVADYALSNDYLMNGYYDDVRQRVLERGENWDYVRPLLYCHPEAMRQTLAHLADRYGGAEPYLRGIGLSTTELAALRDALIEPTA